MSYLNDICPYCGREVHINPILPNHISTTVTKTRKGHKVTTVHMAHMHCAYPGEKGNKMQDKLQKGGLSRIWLNKEIS